MSDWIVRAENGDTDIAGVRAVNLAAFPTAEEADLVDALRLDRVAWIPGLSMMAVTAHGDCVAHALITRGFIDGHPIANLAPCAVRPDHQRRGVGTTTIEAVLAAAARLGENLVTVLGHPEYYPRFGFVPASRFEVRAPIQVPEEAMMAMSLRPGEPVPQGVITYPAPFGI